jgi:hypothetical protein
VVAFDTFDARGNFGPPAVDPKSSGTVEVRGDTVAINYDVNDVHYEVVYDVVRR